MLDSKKDRYQTRERLYQQISQQCEAYLKINPADENIRSLQNENNQEHQKLLGKMAKAGIPAFPIEQVQSSLQSEHSQQDQVQANTQGPFQDQLQATQDDIFINNVTDYDAVSVIESDSSMSQQVLGELQGARVIHVEDISETDGELEYNDVKNQLMENDRVQQAADISQSQIFSEHYSPISSPMESDSDSSIELAIWEDGLHNKNEDILPMNRLPDSSGYTDLNVVEEEMDEIQAQGAISSDSAPDSSPASNSIYDVIDSKSGDISKTHVRAGGNIYESTSAVLDGDYDNNFSHEASSGPKPLTGDATKAHPTDPMKSKAAESHRNENSATASDEMKIKGPGTSQ